MIERLCVIVGAADACVAGLREAFKLHSVRAVAVGDPQSAARLFEQIQVDAVVLNADAFGNDADRMRLAPRGVFRVDSGIHDSPFFAAVGN